MLSVKGLDVHYGRISAVRGLSFQAACGEIVCFVGANGAGKSSILLGTMGLVPAQGEISFDGTRIDKKPTLQRISQGLALVPEGRHVFPEMSVADNLRLGFRNGARDLGRQRLAEALAYFPRLSERLEQKAGTLSGGEQQMLAIGRALMSGPKILLLDEPTLGLAPIMVHHLVDLLRTLREDGLGIVLAEQNLHMALSVSDRGYVIQNGELAMDAAAGVLKNDSRVQRAYLGAG